MHAVRSSLLLLLASLAAPATAGEPFYLQSNDRVVFYGDSITDQRLYTTFIETYVVTRFPERNVQFVHSGWGGDRVTGGGGGPIDVRLKRDVFAYRPTVMTIMLGMNDGSYRAFDESIFKTYANGMDSIVEKVKAELPGIKITLIQPSPFDDVTRKPTFEGGYNAVLVRYGDYLKELAEKQGATLADLNTSVVEATKKAFDAVGEQATTLNPDRVHPAPGGQLLMAAALLDAWKAPALVSNVQLNVKGEANVEVEKLENAKVKDLAQENGGLHWTQRDDSLPFPMDTKDKGIKLALDSSDVLNQLNRQTLRVKGLESDRFDLKIDGQEVGSFSKQELADGVNLATLSTPMSKQAAEVHAQTLLHNQIHFVRWRQIQVPLSKLTSPFLDETLADLDRLEGEIVAKQRELAQPKEHRFQLTPKG